MSKLFSRAGTTAQKYVFSITVHSVTMTLSIPVRVSVAWKMRNKKIETSKKPAMSPSTGEALLDEELSMTNTLYTKKKTGKTNEKKAIIMVQAVVEGHGAKRVGMVKLNLANYKEAGVQKKTFPLTQCPDKYGQCTLSIRAIPEGQEMEPENASDASGGTWQSSGTDGNYTGPALAAPGQDQDLTGFQEPSMSLDSSIAPVTMAPRALPARQALPTNGPINPVQLAKLAEEAKDTMALELDEANAKASVLERDNKSLKKERRSLKKQLNEQEKVSKDDREKLIGHIQEQDAKLKEMNILNVQSTDKRRQYKRKMQELKQNWQETIAKLGSTQQTSEEADKLRNQNLELQSTINSLNINNDELIRGFKKVKEEKRGLKRDVQLAKEEHTGLTQSLNTLRLELEQSRETLSSRGQEADEAFESYKQKTEAVIADLKEALGRSEYVKKQALVKNTELAETVAVNTEMASQASESTILNLQKELADTKEAKISLEITLERSSKDIETLKNSITADMNTMHSKVDKLKIHNGQLGTEKIELERKLYELEQQLIQKDLEKDDVGKQLMQKQLDKKERKISRLEKHAEKRKGKIEDLQTAKKSLEEDLAIAKQQIKVASSTEFSDPATIILTEQVRDLEYKLEKQEQQADSERARLTKKVRQLNKEIDLLEQKIQCESRFHEKEVSKLQTECETYRKSAEDVQYTPAPVADDTAELQKLCDQIKLLRIEKNALKEKLESETQSTQSAYELLSDSKLSLASVESERNSATQKANVAEEKLQQTEEAYNKLEVDLYRVSEKLGASLNRTNELELAIFAITDKMEQVEKSQGKKSK